MVAFSKEAAHISDMRNARSLDEKLHEKGGVTERGYAAWKRAKIETALEQSQDREVMIPAEKLLRDLGIER